jgi:hypothetical protein
MDARRISRARAGSDEGDGEGGSAGGGGGREGERLGVACEHESAERSGAQRQRGVARRPSIVPYSAGVISAPRAQRARLTRRGRTPRH